MPCAPSSMAPGCRPPSRRALRDDLGLLPCHGLRDWLDAARIDAGPILLKDDRHGHVGANRVSPACLNDGRQMFIRLDEAHRARAAGKPLACPPRGRILARHIRSPMDYGAAPTTERGWCRNPRIATRRPNGCRGFRRGIAHPRRGPVVCSRRLRRPSSSAPSLGSARPAKFALALGQRGEHTGGFEYIAVIAPT